MWKLIVPLLLVPAGEARAAVHRTDNFEVQADTEQVARRGGESAERHRRDLARRWTGKALPRWPERCPVLVKLDALSSGGASTFTFDKGKVLSRSIEVEGELGRILTSLLPHEITHAILADVLGRPVPRWADEGAAVLAEPSAKRQRHEKLALGILNGGRAIPLSRLLALTEYPRDVIALFAQGATLTRFLVESKGRKAFLAFVRDGADGAWEPAVRRHYGYASLAKLEEAWLKSRPEESPEPP